MSSADEANVEPLIIGQAYNIVYCPDAIVKNKGPETVRDYLKRRRCIAFGHLSIKRNQGYRVSTMSGIKILRIYLRHMRFDKKHIFWMPAIMFLEVYGRFLGYCDFRFKKHSNGIWDIAQTTKKLVGEAKDPKPKIKNIKEKYVRSAA